MNNRDVNMWYGGVLYYWKLVHIIKLNYSVIFTIALSKYELANTTHPRGIKTNKLSFTSNSFARPIYIREYEEDEPYIKAS